MTKKQGKKLIIMIPCYNEEKTLPLVIKSIPKKIPGISKTRILVVDDGSTDGTYRVAEKLKVDYIVRHRQNMGLARAFSTGLEKALEQKADVIVNTDGDNQYPQKDIPKLIRPILEGKAEIVIGDRQTSKISYFSPIKKFFQRFGSYIVRFISDTDIPDVVSGFRAYSREAALHTNILTDYSYTIEAIIQAGKKRIPIVSVPIKVNPKSRESHLYHSVWGYIKQSAGTIVRVFAMYEPLKIFFYVGGFIFFIGFVFLVRFFYFYFKNEGQGHIQSVIIATVFILVGFQIVITGLIADLIANNRKLIEEILLNKKRENKWTSKIK